MSAWIGLDSVEFSQLVSFFVVPLGILIVSWLIQQHFEARLNAGVEFFAFLAALDFAFLAQSRTGTVRINPSLSEDYYPLFVFLVILSLVALSYSARVQSLIYRHLSTRAKRSAADGTKNYYPLGRVLVCWTLALAGIGFHLFVTLGGGT